MAQKPPDKTEYKSRNEEILEQIKHQAKMSNTVNYHGYGVCPACGYCPYCGRGRQMSPHGPPSPYPIRWTTSGIGFGDSYGY